MPYYLFAQKAGSELNDYTKWVSTVEIGEGCDDHDEDKVEYHAQGAGEKPGNECRRFRKF